MTASELSPGEHNSNVCLLDIYARQSFVLEKSALVYMFRKEAQPVSPRPIPSHVPNSPKHAPPPHHEFDLHTNKI